MILSRLYTIICDFVEWSNATTFYSYFSKERQRKQKKELALFPPWELEREGAQREERENKKERKEEEALPLLTAIQDGGHPGRGLFQHRRSGKLQVGKKHD